MKVTVTKEGVLVPREYLEGLGELEGLAEVEIVRERGRVLIVPVDGEDPIHGLGSRPVRCGVKDAAERHDEYLYSAS